MSYKILGESGIVSYPILGEPRGKIAYSSKVLNTRSGNLIQYIPFKEPVGSVNAIDLSPEGNDAVYNTTLLGVPGIGDGLTAARLNGVAGYIDIYSAALNADFDGAEGTAMIWGRVDAGVWTDATIRTLAGLRVDGPNRFHIQKSAVNDQILVFRRAGGVNSTVVYTTSAPTTYFFVGYTWSETADEVKLYYKDDVTPFGQVGVTQNGLGAWVGNLSNTLSLVGAINQVGGEVWDGDESHWALWNAPLTEAELMNLSIR